MGFFPTERALGYARSHNKQRRLPHEDIANELIEDGIHIEDWVKAQYQVQGLDPNAEDGVTLDALSHIDEVADHYYAKGYRIVNGKE